MDRHFVDVGGLCTVVALSPARNSITDNGSGVEVDEDSVAAY